jgi:hypothetical protein
VQMKNAPDEIPIRCINIANLPPGRLFTMITDAIAGYFSEQDFESLFVRNPDRIKSLEEIFLL